MKESLKIGLYLQTNDVCNENDFNKASEIIRSSDMDLVVFPEVAYFPFESQFAEADILNPDEYAALEDKTIELSEALGRAVMICNVDRYQSTLAIYANAFASDEETLVKDYLKHTMTGFSAFDLSDYPEVIDDLFNPIILKGNRIGMTICYDCNHSVFSRKYGQNNVDVILNSTGGDVVYDKWFKYNKVRAIENNCHVFVTMGGSGDSKAAQSCVFGFNPKGKAMTPTLINGKDTELHNVAGGLYMYDISADDGMDEPDKSINQTETANKKFDILLSKGDLDKILAGGKKVDDDIVVVNFKDNNIVFCIVNGEDIFKPEKILRLLYSKKIRDINSKKYVIANRWKFIDQDLYDKKLSVVLKVRAMENYCAVMLVSDNMTKCFQCGYNRTAQVVKPTGQDFGIDLSRTDGPEVIWKDKTGMKASWRKNMEILVESLK